MGTATGQAWLKANPKIWLGSSSKSRRGEGVGPWVQLDDGAGKFIWQLDERCDLLCRECCGVMLAGFWA